MDVTNAFGIVIYSLAAFVGAVLLVDLVLDYRWTRMAKTMHAKGPQEK